MAAAGALRVTIGVAGGAGERAVRKHALELILLARLGDGEEAGRRVPREQVRAVELDDHGTVATQVAVLVVPQLASRGVANVGRADEDCGVVRTGRTGRAVVLVE